MANPERIVSRLRLKACDESAAKRTAIRLEDALRTASLPADGGRLWLVRRLNLGRIPANASPQTLALLLEQQLARQGANAVYVLDSGAAHADVVWFRDSLQAHTLLALRLAAGNPADAWFWRRALPGWQTDWDRHTSIRWLAFSLARRTEAAVALPQWACSLAQAGFGGVLLESLQPGDGEALAHCCQFALSQYCPRQSAAEALAMDDRRAWLDGCLHAAGGQASMPSQPVPASRPAELSPVQQTSEPILDQSAHSAPPRRPALPAVTESTPDPLSRPSVQAVTPHDDFTQTGPRIHPAASLFATPPASSARPSEVANPRDPLERLEPPAVASIPSVSNMNPHQARAAQGVESQALPVFNLYPEGEPTQAAGLLFLLPVLSQLGYAQWVLDCPDWGNADVVRKLLSLLLTRLRLPPEDPAWCLAETRQFNPIPTGFSAPLAWKPLCRKPLCFSLTQRQCWDGTGRLLLAECQDGLDGLTDAWMADAQLAAIAAKARENDLLARVSAAWLTACRRWLRRNAGMGLADLVAKPGWVSHTPTHIDMEFELNAADIRVRRLGLDIDPGWLPWFGRVVSFHYGRLTW